MLDAIVTLGAALVAAAFAGRPRSLGLPETGRDGARDVPMPSDAPLTWDDVDIDDIKRIGDETSSAPNSQLHRDARNWLYESKHDHEPTRKRLLAALNRERVAMLKAVGRKPRSTVSPCDAEDDEPSGPVYDAWRCGDLCQTYEDISREKFRESVEASQRGDYSVRRTPRVILSIMAKQKRRAWKEMRGQCNPDVTAGWTIEPYRIGCCERLRARDPSGVVQGRNFKTEDEATAFVRDFYTVPF